MFNGTENARISIQAICEIGRGSDQILHINATSDTVKCEVQDHILDYGLQVCKIDAECY